MTIRPSSACSKGGVGTSGPDGLQADLPAGRAPRSRHYHGTTITFTRVGCVLALVLLFAGCVSFPPAAPREFRAAWVATVANIDWPSKPGLPVERQRAEALAILERARTLKLNAIILQVRPAADALYASSLEPWSEFLTGQQGRAPEPFYDPLQFWVTEAHRRGLELHAWFNPYRARHSAAKSPPAANHISKTNPEAVKTYGAFEWMDPGEPFAARRTLEVISEVVRNYDVDGVHIDDYFYPYPIPAPPAGTPAGSIPLGSKQPPPEVDFPDEPAWQRYLAVRGKLSRADWRRQNVDYLVEDIYRAIHRIKPWVRFGVSPFGIGRPDRRPKGIAGFSQYDKLYADAELWLQKGWLDYFAPQLYWPKEKKAQDYATLLDYWVSQNTAHRHLWPGLFTSSINDTPKSWAPEEITHQIDLTRANPRADGHIHYSMIALMQDRHGISGKLAAGPY
ncbi:MAG: family 10 glycosylhydrolase, partial [Undibacterium sp.]|nr:family 10 glycosylhydrolase [Opitutaceae bacterium]